MMINIIFAIALTLVSVPDGRCVLINGLRGEGEWEGSTALQLDEDTEMRVHKDTENLFVAIVFHGPRHTGLDLYIQSGSRTHMLHVSSALGEKIQEDGQWSELSWGQNTWWSSNMIGSIFEDGSQRFLEPDAFELQLNRRELGPEVNLFVHLKRPEKKLPTGASEADPDKWIKLTLK